MFRGQRTSSGVILHLPPRLRQSRVQCPVNKTSLWTWEALPSPPFPFGSSAITDVSYYIRLSVEFGDLSSASSSPSEQSLQPAFPNSCWFKSGWWTLEHVLAKLRRTQQSFWGQERETFKMKRGVCARWRTGPSRGVSVLPDDKASLLCKVLHDLRDSMPLCFMQASRDIPSCHPEH